MRSCNAFYNLLSEVTHHRKKQVTKSSPHARGEELGSISLSYSLKERYQRIYEHHMMEQVLQLKVSHFVLNSEIMCTDCMTVTCFSLSLAA